MELQLDILRQEKAAAEPYTESFRIAAEDDSLTVMNALTMLNARLAAEGRPPVRFECSCGQRKCGACAMRINGRPMLACDARILPLEKKGHILLEPLRKFPVVADLIVDRSILFANLRTLAVWLEKDTVAKGKKGVLAYEASRCLQCGLCLEVCPNFCAEGAFFGMAAFVPTARLLSELPKEERESLCKAYRSHIYEGCGKSLACRNICPAGIDIDRLLVHSNAAAVWKLT